MTLTCVQFEDTRAPVPALGSVRWMGITFVRFAKRRCASRVYNGYTETIRPTSLVGRS